MVIVKVAGNSTKEASVPVISQLEIRGNSLMYPLNCNLYILRDYFAFEHTPNFSI